MPTPPLPETKESTSKSNSSPHCPPYRPPLPFSATYRNMLRSPTSVSLKIKFAANGTSRVFRSIFSCVKNKDSKKKSLFLHILNNWLMRIHADMKMADLVHLNFEVLAVVQRLQIPFGFKDKTISDVCREHSINVDFFLQLVQWFNERENLPQEQLIQGVVERL